MNRARILKAVVIKEITEALREKHVRAVLAVGLLFPLYIGWLGIHEFREKGKDAKEAVERIEEGDANGEGIGLPQDSDTAADSFSIVMAVGYGPLLAVFFAVTLGVEAFVGEKERKTIEVLLASPASDRELFAAKVAACTVFSLGLGVVMAAMGTVMLSILAWIYGKGLPAEDVGKTLMGSGLLLISLSVPFTCVGAIISSRVNTVKAGAQIFGIVMLVLFLSVMVISVALKEQLKPLIEALVVVAFLPAWLKWVSGIALVGVLDWVTLSAGASVFNREKMLTDM